MAMTELDHVKTKGEARYDKLWEVWRQDYNDATDQVKHQHDLIRAYGVQGMREDISNECLDALIQDELARLGRLQRRRTVVMIRAGWLLVVTALSPVLIPLSDMFDGWMYNPDPDRF